MITLLLVDDQVSVRRGLRMRLELEPDLQVVGEAADGEAALTQAVALQPQVVVMDVEMPRMDGITATAALRTLAPQTRVVMLSLHHDQATHDRAIAAGAVAFVEKRAVEPGLLRSIRQVGGVLFSSDI